MNLIGDFGGDALYLAMGVQAGILSVAVSPEPDSFEAGPDSRINRQSRTSFTVPLR